MPRFAANLSLMFNEVPFLDRFAAAARAGFQAVEYLFPYEHPPTELRRRLADNGLVQALFNAPPGDWAAGERGIAALPGRQREFREAIARALDYAAALDCPLVHVMAGIPPAGVSPVTAAAVYATNLAWAAEQAKSAGKRLVIEPINHRDFPGYHLHTLEQGAAIVAAIGPEALGLQFDIYHCQITQGDVSKRLEAFMPIVGHIQIADVPDRHEPGTGELGWEHLFRRIDALGYAGWIGCEYRPAGETVAGLGWRQRYGV
jgi:hydroxypyruvate isomerase